jgi:two-component system sensor histidine kinase/response regulator
LKFYLLLIFSFISLKGFAAVNKSEVDSLKLLMANALYDKSVPDTGTVNRLNKLAGAYFQINPDSTFYYAQKSISLARKAKYSAGVAAGLLQAGHVNYFKGNFDPARKNFDEALFLYKNLHDNRGISACYISYARMYSLLADYKTSFNYLQLAFVIDKKINDERGLTDYYKNMGIVYFSQGQLSKSLDYYYNGLFLALKNHYTVLSGEIYNDIGYVLQTMEVYPNALQYYHKALHVFEGTDDIQDIGTINENIGEILIAQEQYDAGINYLSNALIIARKQGDKDGLSSLYTDLGLCYAYKNQFPRAINYVDTALAIAGQYKNIFNEAYASIGLSTIYNLQKDYKNASKYAIQGQKLADVLGNLSVRANAALQLNKTLAGLGKFKEAYQSLNQYLDLKNKLKNDESIQKLTSYNFELNFAEKQRQLAVHQHVVDLLYQQKLQKQRLINTIFLIIILAMVVTLVVYYRQKRKQQVINIMLEEKNHEVLEQKANIDEQAQKLNNLNTLKDRLISVLAHDLRAPLSTLRGLFSLLQDDTITHEQLIELIPNVLKKLEYTSDFLDTLLFWINSQMENFDCAEKSFSIKGTVAYEVEGYREQAASKGISLVDNVPDDMMASADPNSIRIVIRNLITNAIKFSGKGDKIEINAGLQGKKNIIVSVKDTGMGISPAQLTKLFKSKVDSHTGTQNEPGTGMGLLFCKDLVEKCNGKIWVTSKLGHGAEFLFTLPVSVQEHISA